MRRSTRCKSALEAEDNNLLKTIGYINLMRNSSGLFDFIGVNPR